MRYLTAVRGMTNVHGSSTAPAVCIPTCLRSTTVQITDLRFGTLEISAASTRFRRQLVDMVFPAGRSFGPGVPGVPDGGTTAMLLGAALSVLGVARRYIMS
jgi:VPDSG-CTERM motif